MSTSASHCFTCCVFYWPTRSRPMEINHSNQQQQQQSPAERPNEVTYVDFLAKLNAARHHTIKYEIKAHLLVLRRGEPFDFNILLGRPFNATQDKFRLEFCFGNYPNLKDESLVYVPLVTSDKLLPESLNDTNSAITSWNARILDVERRQLNVRVHLPSQLPVGTWRLRISTKLANSTTMQTFSIRDAFYVIFNAWNTNDDVYMNQDEARQEYVLNEVGKIYVGSASNPVGHKWTYGQFDVSVLPTVIQLLDKTRLTISERADVVKTARAVSALVNSNDEGGLLVGNWSGSYNDGLSPWQWTSSSVIFKKYVQDGYRSVKFGQCWVFGGMTTTSLRTLGIPARTISNFVSAHDTDSSLTVDKFPPGVNNVNGDSIWNFHVWSDAWMLRHDLPPGFGGWQAIDATPQERSDGAYQLGPASLEAIKQGKTGWAYDVAFVFSEVNANLVYWQQDGRARLQWRKTSVQAGQVGKRILTKMIGVLDDSRRGSRSSDAENIVYQYKYVENTPEAKLAYADAVRAAGLQPLFDNRRRRRQFQV